jgi:hypothetical protein
MKFRILLFAFAVAVTIPAMAADPELKPGLWETKVHMQMTGMPQLTAEQIAQMKQMGIEMPFLSGQPTTIQQCITPEQASLQKPIEPSAKPEDQCTVRNYKKSGKTVSGDMVCNGDLKAQGHFEMTVNSNTSYKGKWALKGVTKEGQPIDQTTDISARWLKAKCDPGIATAP